MTGIEDLKQRGKVEGARFYEHRDLYDSCQACRSCLDKCYLLTPFEEVRLPLPWQGTVGPRVKVLFLFAKPSYTNLSPRLSDYPDASALREMLERQYELHAIAFKRRQALKGSFRTYARKITSVLLETPESTISDFDDYLFTSLVRCNAAEMRDRESLEYQANECLGRHAADLADRLPNLQWIVPVGNATHQLLSAPRVSVKFRKAFRVSDVGRTYHLPPLASGVSDVAVLNERVRLIAVPHFSRRTFRAEHYRRIFASWMSRPPLPGGGRPGAVRGVARAADAPLLPL